MFFQRLSRDYVMTEGLAEYWAGFIERLGAERIIGPRRDALIEKIRRDAISEEELAELVGENALDLIKAMVLVGGGYVRPLVKSAAFRHLPAEKQRRILEAVEPRLSVVSAESRAMLLRLLTLEGPPPDERALQIRKVVVAAGAIQRHLLPERYRDGLAVPPATREFDADEIARAHQEALDHAAEQHPDIGSHWRTMQGVAALFNSTDFDALYFEARLEAFYLLARFLDENGGTAANDPIVMPARGDRRVQ